MSNQKFNKLYPLLSLIFSLPVLAQNPERITAIHFNKGKVERIYMAPGLATALTFPCDLDEATVGRDEDLKAKVSPTSKRHLSLFLATSVSLPTNLIVRCGDKQELYVFDVVPSVINHQDVLRITGSYGGAGLKDNHIQLIDSDQRGREQFEQKRSRQRIDPKTIVLKDSSESYKPPTKHPVIVERKKPEQIVDAPIDTDLKSLESRRSTVIIVDQPQLIEERVRTQEKDEFKRNLNGHDIVTNGSEK